MAAHSNGRVLTKGDAVKFEGLNHAKCLHVLAIFWKKGLSNDPQMHLFRARLRRPEAPSPQRIGVLPYPHPPSVIQNKNSSEL